MVRLRKRLWHIEEFEGAQGLRRLERDWHRLVSAMPGRAWHHEYTTHLAYVEHIKSSPGRFIAFALRDEAGVQAICPLEQRQRPLFGWATPVWQLPCDGNTLVRDVICPPGEGRRVLLPVLLEHFRSGNVHPRWIVLGRIMKGSAAWDCLSHVSSGNVCVDRDDAADLLDARLTPQEHADRYSRNFRGNLRKARNKLAKMPGVQFVSVSDPQGVAREFAALLDLEAAGWKGASGTGTAIRLLDGTREYYQTLLASVPGVEINALYAGRRCLASQLCIRTGSDYAIIKISYDEEYRKVGPGQLLLEHTLARCCGDPGIQFVNLVSHYDWHQDWKPEVVPVVDAYLHTDRYLGWSYLALLRARFRYGPVVKARLEPFGKALRRG